MNVGIDLTALLPEATGVDNYMLNLVLHLARLDHANRYMIFVNRADRDRFAGVLPRNFALVPICFRPRPARLTFQQVILPAAATALGLDVVHSPSFIMPLYRGRQRHLLTVHDMTIFSLPHYHIPLRRSALFRRVVAWSIRHADLVSVPSRSVQQDISRLLYSVPPERIRVIPQGIRDVFRPRPAEQAHARARRLGISAPYILYVGTIEPRKNLRRLVESYRQLITRDRVVEHLVLAGRLGWDYDGLLSQLSSPELRDRVHLTSYVHQDDLPWLYAGARLFVYPSWHEGFGFPPLEAMASGVPTIASRSSALAENLEGAAELVAPGDVEALTAAMRRLLHDDRLRLERTEQGLRRAAQFRWDQAARQVIGCYEELARSR